MFIICLKKHPVCRHFLTSMLCWTSLSAIPLAQTTAQSPHTHRLHEWVTSEEALLDFIKFIRRQKELSTAQYLNRGTHAGSSLPKLYFVSTYAVVSLSFLGSSAGQLFHQAVCRVFYVHSTLTHSSFHTKLVFWLRFLHRTVYHYRIHRKTKFITANVDFCSFLC